ncbi:hypothetical protein RDWZM_010615 [Blomia tropicalis]|uniref:DNA-directed RNA polymerase n=1 Tax=Blomia tropicalis TaxID=40697 RepID=A0A9Q0M0S3_BLOTA|nr:hypothetical protein RDWZM_010615 [Blomia tropicalis]
MAVHVPLSLEAQAEARLLMFSHMNLLSPAIGDPISIPTQDMLIGLYAKEFDDTNRNSDLFTSTRPVVPEFLRESRSRRGSFPTTDSNPLSNRTQQNMEVLMAERANLVFHNKVIDGTAMKRLISRLIDHFGMAYTSHILDQVKTLGFQQATATSISLGIDDLLTIPSKRWLVQDAEQQSLILEKHHHYGNVHAVEKLRQSIEIWYATSEYLRQEMNPNFRMTDPLNPVHIMSFSGARGNASQVHQLVGMRGLMSDPQGQMIDLPIQSNLREGLSLTEYIISCYGARKGVVDTAVRTSDAGYLTRRLVEVVQHIVVRRIDCGTARGISVSPQNGMMPERIFIQTLIGRVLADDIYMGTRCIATRNQDIGIGLVNRFITFRAQPIAIRTPFTCRSASWICRLCYGRSPTHGDLVELGEAVGIIAGQSIGEPGTQLTLRTFHTVQNDQYVESEQVIAEIRAGTSTLNFKEKIRKHIYSDSDGEMHWSTDVYHAPEFTYGSVHLLPKTSHLWILLAEPRESSLVSLSLHKDQDQMSANSRSVKSLNLSGTDDQLREKFFTSDFSGKKEDRIPDYSDLSRIICTGRCNLVDPTLLYHNSDLFSKRRRNRFIIPLQSIQERENGLTHPSDILIEIPINGIFRRNSILAYLDDPRYRRKSSGITKYGTLEMHSIVKKEDLIEYRGGKEFSPKYQMKVDHKISRHSGVLIPLRTGKRNSKESKKRENWIYVQRITPSKKKYFVLVRPVVTYEITDGITLGTLFPPDLLQERDNVKLRVVNYILYGNGKPIRGISDTNIQLVRTLIRSAKTYLATPGATVHGHYGEILYEGDTLITFIYEKSRSGDITQGLPKVEQVLEVRSIDSISMNLEKRIEGWNERITRILGMPWAFLIGAELTIVQSRISLVNKIQKVYRSQGVQIHNRHIEIIVRQITSRVLVSEDGMSNVFSPGELIGLVRAERMGRALEEAVCYRALLLGITRASLNTQSFISEASFQETARVLAKAALRGRIDWLKGLKENVVLGV